MLQRLRRWLRGGAGAAPTSAAAPAPGSPVAGPDAAAEPTHGPVAERCDCETIETQGEPSRSELLTTLIGIVVTGLAVIVLINSPGNGASYALLQIGSIFVLATVLLMGVGAMGSREGYLAGIWLVSVLSPWILAIVTVLAYLVVSTIKPADGTNPATLIPPDNLDARLRCLYVGISAAAAFLAAAGLLGRSIASRSRAQAHIYDQLRDRRSQLRDRHTRLDKSRRDVAPTRLAQFDTLMLEAKSRLEAAEYELCDKETGGPSLRWARATGYSSLIRSLHRIEEMILAAQPDEAVLGDAFNDFLSLNGSTIAEREALLANLRAAAFAIDAASADTFFSLTGPSTRPAHQTPSPEVAREILREVRFAINEFRDARVDKQIGTRNSLVLVILAVAVVTYLTLGVAILAGVSVVALLSASVYFLVGAVAGLLNRLRIEASKTTAVEDYGLSLMRLVAAPLLSGLAAVGGVYLVSKSPELFGALFGPEQTYPNQSAQQIFDLAQNEAGVVVAVVFGFVPAAFFSGVERQAERFQSELEKSEPSGGSSASAGT